MRIRVGVVLLGAAVAVAGSGFALTSSAAGHKDPNLAKARALVDKQCPAKTRTISAGLWEAGWKFNVLYGNCRAGDGRDQHAWFFDRGRFVRMDARSSSHEIIGLWRNASTIALLYVLYRRSDPECCATGGGAIVRYRLEQGRVRRLDPLPRRR
ncbi:MAG TPA: LppP/LprE family lipoprotein [Gaiellaceae bacterium]|nr:LppP/LprE family lipoprotein [Gaiellaceae bacterium]